MSRIPILLLVGLLILTAAVSVGADGAHDLSWYSVAGGGGTAEGSGYALRGTAGQAAAGAMAAGDYRLAAGFSGGGVPPEPYYPLYLPLVSRSGS